MAEIRVCPERDAACPHGMSCAYVLDRYTCREGWNSPMTSPDQAPGAMRERIDRMLIAFTEDEESFTSEDARIKLRDAILELTSSASLGRTEDIQYTLDRAADFAANYSNGQITDKDTWAEGFAFAKRMIAENLRGMAPVISASLGVVPAPGNSEWNAAIETAAKVADDQWLPSDNCLSREYVSWTNRKAKDIAKLIRALTRPAVREAK